MTSTDPGRGHPMRYRTRRDDEPGPIYTGRRVLDVHGLPLGTVTDVVYAQGAYEPEYLAVDPGLLRRSHYVPTAGASQTTDGDIVVAWDRDWFRLAPRAAGRPGALSPHERRALESHYARH